VTLPFGRGALVAGAVGLGLLLLAAPRADGAFPGRNGKVAVYDGKALMFVSPDGKGAEIARDRRGKLFNPSGFTFAPGGKRIAFECRPPGPAIRSAICTVNTDGSGRRVVIKTTRLGDEVYGPVWSPDAKRIAFVRYVSRVGTSVNVVNADGTELTRIRTPRGLCISRALQYPRNAGGPMWAADGLIALMCYTGPQGRQLLLETTSPAKPAHVVDCPWMNPTTVWDYEFSPDASRIALTDGGRLVTITARPRRLENGKLDCDERVVMEPQPVGIAWSPDGREIAFVGDESGGPVLGYVDGSDLYVINADGSGKPKSIYRSARRPGMLRPGVAWQCLGACRLH